jgi:hypothetical protein
MRLSRFSLVVPFLFLAGCHHQTPVPVVNTPTPASTIALEAAKREFAVGDYASAAVDFQRYLQLVPTDGDGDYALFQLGTIFSLPESGRQDWVRAASYFNRLVTDFPQSSLKPAAQLILSTREQSVQLTASIARLTEEAAQLRATSADQINQIAKLRSDADQQAEQIGKSKAEAEQQAQEVQKRELQIRQLNVQIDQLKTQLDRLIRVDSERRPRP